MAIQYQQPRRRFTVDEYHKMADAGILGEDDRVELLDGEIVEMPAIKVPHAACVDSLNMLFAQRIGDRGIVRIQSPIYIDDINEPQPDVILLKPGDYMNRRYHPGPDDILLVIEVAGTTLRTDRRDKMPRYARAGMQETWLVNLPKKMVEVYSNPEDGKYGNVQRVGRGHTIAPQARPDVAIRVEDFLGS